MMGKRREVRAVKRRMIWLAAAVALLAAALLLALTLKGGRQEGALLPGSSAGLGMMLLEKEQGLYVLAVTADSPAERADVRPGDYLVRAGEETLRSTAQLDALIDSDAGVLELCLKRNERELVIQLPTR